MSSPIAVCRPRELGASARGPLAKRRALSPRSHAGSASPGRRVMAAVRDYGTRLSIDDPGRVETVTSLGIDETAFLKANAEHPTMYVTGLVDHERRVLIDMIEGNRAIDVSRRLSAKDEAFLTGIATGGCRAATVWRGRRPGARRAAVRRDLPHGPAPLATPVVDVAELTDPVVALPRVGDDRGPGSTCAVTKGRSEAATTGA